VGNGNRTRNRRSHSPVLCQLSYSHHQADYSNWGSRMSERFPPEVRRLLRENWVDYSSAKRRHQKARTRCVREEKDTQNRAKEKLLRVPERKTERRECKARFSEWRAGLADSLLTVYGEIRRSLACLSRWTAGVAEGTTHPRPTPTYSKPMARSRAESSRFFVSTITGFLSRCLMRSKSRARNSGQPVPTTSASIPSAAA
jgi:hypothetical protein